MSQWRSQDRVACVNIRGGMPQTLSLTRHGGLQIRLEEFRGLVERIIIRVHIFGGIIGFGQRWRGVLSLAFPEERHCF